MSAEDLNSDAIRKTLKKHEILRGHRQFSRVMTEGKLLSGKILRCFVSRSASCEGPGADSVKVGFTVSRRFRKPTVRNRIKRLMREAYRVHKVRLYQFAKRKSLRLDLVLLFRGKPDSDPRKLPYALIEKDFLVILDRLEHAADGV